MSEKKCFVISPIGKPKSKKIKDANTVFEYVISKAVLPLNYTPIRSDQIAKSGNITIQIIEQIKNAELVIADVREKNLNVFYELAIRHVTKKPYILLKKPWRNLPFDIADCRAIDLNIAEPESVENAIENIKAQIKSMGEETTNPLSVALDNLFLHESQKPMENQVSAIFKTVSDIGATVGVEIDKQLQEAKLRASIERNTAAKIWKPLSSLRSSLKVFQSNNDNLSVQLQEEVKKLEDTCKELSCLCSLLIRPRTEIPWLAMQKLHNQNKESSQH